MTNNEKGEINRYSAELISDRADLDREIIKLRKGEEYLENLTRTIKGLRDGINNVLRAEENAGMFDDAEKKSGTTVDDNGNNIKWFMESSNPYAIIFTEKKTEAQVLKNFKTKKMKKYIGTYLLRQKVVKDFLAGKLTKKDFENHNMAFRSPSFSIEFED